MLCVIYLPIATTSLKRNANLECAPNLENEFFSFPRTCEESQWDMTLEAKIVFPYVLVKYKS